MNISDNLYTLVKSLSKSEKRHFKLYATTFSSSNNYLKLFDAIDQLDIYDEQAIKKKFANELFTKQLHVTKNYLSKQILKSLGIFSTYHSRESELRSILRNVEILFRRELHNHCKTEIKRAEQIATQYEFFTLHLDVLSFKRKIIISTSGSLEGYPSLEQIFEQEKELLQKKLVLNQYWTLVAKISEVFRGKYSWDEIMSSPLLNNIKNANSIRAKILYHHIHYSYNITNRNSTEALIHINKLILLLELNPHRIVEEPASYITSLNNKIGLLLDLRHHDSIPPLLNKIRSASEKYNLPVRSSSTVRLLSRTYNVELELYRDTHQFEKGKQTISTVENFISKNDDIVPAVYKQMFYYQFAYILFKTGSYSESLKWINEIINSRFKEERDDILIYSRFLNMIIHYELNNTYVLKYAVESTRRYLRKRKKLTSFAKNLLKYFSSLSTKPKSKHTQIFNKMKSEIFLGVSEHEKRNILDYIDFESWIASKC